jgi:hypothetical protein
MLGPTHVQADPQRVGATSCSNTPDVSDMRCYGYRTGLATLSTSTNRYCATLSKTEREITWIENSTGGINAYRTDDCSLCVVTRWIARCTWQRMPPADDAPAHTLFSHHSVTFNAACFLKQSRNNETLRYWIRARVAQSLWAGRSGDRIPVGVRFSAPVQTDPGIPQRPLQWVPRLFPGGKAAGAWR